MEVRPYKEMWFQLYYGRKSNEGDLINGIVMAKRQNTSRVMMMVTRTYKNNSINESFGEMEKVTDVDKDTHALKK